MSAVVEKLTHEALGLPAKERAKLAHDLIASLEPEDAGAVESAWDREIERRAEEIKLGKAQGRPAEQVLAEIRAKYQ